MSAGRGSQAGDFRSAITCIGSADNKALRVSNVAVLFRNILIYLVLLPDVAMVLSRFPIYTLLVTSSLNLSHKRAESIFIRLSKSAAPNDLEPLVLN